MTVTVQSYSYGCVAQKLLNELGVDVLEQEQGGTCVPEIVEADVGETSALQERREAPLSEVRRVDRRPGFGCKDETLVAVAVSEGFHLL